MGGAHQFRKRVTFAGIIEIHYLIIVQEESECAGEGRRAEGSGWGGRKNQ